MPGGIEPGGIEPGEIDPLDIEPIVINGEEYIPLPHEVHPELPEGYVWSQKPYHPAFLEDPFWYDGLGQDLVKQRRIWARASESEQVEEFGRLLAERPDRGLDMLFGAAVRGKTHVVRFLLGAGVRPTADEGEGDDGSLAPLHAAAFHGHRECVEIMLQDGKLSVDARDDIGGTPLMRACAGRRAEIVRLLIDAGADILVRQKKGADSDEDGEDENGDDEEHADAAEEGANAFELAALGGSIECAELVLGRAEQLGTPRAELVTALALASAARSDDLDMLGFMLDTGRFPRPPGGGGAWETDALTDGMKEKIEKAFARALRAGKHKALRPLFAYIGDSRRKASAAAAADGGEPQPYWTGLSDETLASLNSALWDFAGHDDDEHLAAFGFVYDIYLDPGSRFTTPAVQEYKAEALDEAFFWAAQHDCVRMMRLIASRHERLDVNHLSRRLKPYFTTALYTAAGSGHAGAVEYLLAEHGERLDVHMGVGKFANGITALGEAVWNGHHDTVRLLLERAGGPVEFLDEDVWLDKGDVRAVVTVTHGKEVLRAPVRVLSEDAWRRERGGDGLRGEKGSTRDEERNEVHYVVIQLGEADAAWWSRLQIRKSDEELVAMEKEREVSNGTPRAIKTRN
ncbi:hypothetical protein DL768_004456 [Monosporascus sp. mg162]|nr:hypothetical protein DL768_004456 [Monosporascus sp. mg162]